MRQFKLVRNDHTENGIFGTLYDDTGKAIAVTLEHSYNLQPKLPNGTFTCVRGSHMLHSGPIETFEITGVAGHTGILFHPGNFNKDSEGCVLLGAKRSGDTISNSLSTFMNFKTLLMGTDQFTLTVEG